MKGPSVLRRKQAREQMLAYIGLTSAEGTLADPRVDPTPDGPNCRVTLVPGRLLVTPHRAARLRGLEAQDYGWPAVALVETEGRFGPDTTSVVIDVSGQLAQLHVDLPAQDLRWALTECGFRVVTVPHAPCARVWVPEDVQPLLPVSLFATT